jgi:hypothetical protein
VAPHATTLAFEAALGARDGVLRILLWQA